ncbi:YdbC family protein [uncultured Dialister sp.]|uniref:YdbC family protein n=1 Tax=uncultured Dialister sp. TaxID=278064 RepID=UPI00258BE11C|nr:PC4/YdbC family ssDNA-binding protein [uncultured Dialister sp.]
MAAKITYTIQDVLGDLSVAANGWKKELTYTSWNNRDEKFDLRSWNSDHSAMTKGITLTKEEILKLKDILNDIDFDKY